MQISIPLLGPVGNVRGMHLKESLPKLAIAAPYLPRPHRLTIAMPNGKPIALTAGSMAFLSHQGEVEGVYARHPLHRLSYPEAVADVRRTLKDMGIEPDAAMRGQMARWPSDEPRTDAATGPRDIRAAMPLGDSVRLEVRVCPDPRGGWYTLLMFRAAIEARSAAGANRWSDPATLLQDPGGRRGNPK